MSGPEDTAERYFGTPERVLRRRHLRPEDVGRFAKEDGEGQPPSEDTDIGPSQGQDSSGAPEAPASAGPSRPSTTSTVDAVIAFFFHLTAFSFYLYFLFDTERVYARIKEEHGLIIPESDKYGGRWKFLTRLNFHLQAGYFLLALLCDILPWLKQYLHKFLDHIFATIAFPAAMSVTALFWGLTVFLRQYSVGDPSSNMQKFLDVVPPHTNHALHTVIGLVVVLEVALVHHRYPSHSDAIKSLLAWNVPYAAWVYWCYFQDGTLPYPILQLLGPYYMSIAFIVLFIVSVTFYYTGKVLSAWCWEARN